MIKSYFGLKKSPFDKADLTLTEQQNTVFDTINAHSKQGGLCVIAGDPGGKAQKYVESKKGDFRR